MLHFEPSFPAPALNDGAAVDFYRFNTYPAGFQYGLSLNLLPHSFNVGIVVHN